MDQIIQQLNNSRNLLVVSHIHPDGDALGSQIAMGLILSALGKEVTLYNENEVPRMYRFLPCMEQIVNKLDRFDVFDAAVILDCGDLKRTGVIEGKLNTMPVVINIDHHVTNTGFGNFQLVDSAACATAEIIYRLIKKIGLPITGAMAFAIYTGIMTDTGSFRFSNTNRSSFSICNEMVGLGVDPHFVANHVYVTYSMSRIKLLNMVLDSIEVSDNGRLSIMVLTQNMLKETDTKAEDLGRLINYARHIEDVKVAALIFESSNGKKKNDKRESEFHISLRSDGSVDVAEIAAGYGGGGHMGAAGFNITATLPEVRSKIIKLAERLNV